MSKQTIIPTVKVSASGLTRLYVGEKQIGEIHKYPSRPGWGLHVRGVYWRNSGEFNFNGGASGINVRTRADGLIAAGVAWAALSSKDTDHG